MRKTGIPDSVTRILLVDDSESWRRQLSDLLSLRQDVQILGQASDGRQALRSAERLQPDLILLDIGLPDTSGIQLVHPLSLCAPRAEVLLLSADNHADTVRIALATGARGYLWKSDAHRELSAAVAAVRRGDRFLSNSVKNLDDATHAVQFYAEDSLLSDCVYECMTAALRQGQSAIVIGSKDHREAIEWKLKSGGVELETLVSNQRYLAFDSCSTLEKLMNGNSVDGQAATSLLSSIIEQAEATSRAEQRKVTFFGEIAPLLIAQGKLAAALELEQIADNVVATHSVYLRCAYGSGLFPREASSSEYSSVCARHSAVIPAPKRAVANM